MNNKLVFSRLVKQVVCGAGESVFAVGHAGFGEEHKLGPSVTAGLISRVVSVHQRPGLIQVG